MWIKKPKPEASDVSQVFQTLFNHLLFRLVELARLVFNDFLQKKTDQSFQIVESTGQKLIGRRTQILGQIDGSALTH
jgi:hypothetical protein